MFERLVKPGDNACVAGNRSCDPPYMFDQWRPAAIALPLVESFGEHLGAFGANTN